MEDVPFRFVDGFATPASPVATGLVANGNFTELLPNGSAADWTVCRQSSLVPNEKGACVEAGESGLCKPVAGAGPGGSGAMVCNVSSSHPTHGLTTGFQSAMFDTEPGRYYSFSAKVTVAPGGSLADRVGSTVYFTLFQDEPSL